MKLETRVQRFEQQLDAFEALHADELKKFEEKLTSYLRLQADEVKFLREELIALKEALAALQPDESASASVSSPNQHRLSPNSTAEPAHSIRREFVDDSGHHRQS
jgi:hypothetical protein